MTAPATTTGLPEQKEATPIQMMWFQPKMGRRLYELRHQGISLATYRSTGVFSTGARVESRYGAWMMEVRGLIRTSIDVLDEGSGLPVASFEQPSIIRAGGEVRVGDGPAYMLIAANARESVWEILDATNHPVMRFRRTKFVHQSRMDVEVLNGALSLREVILFSALSLTNKRAAAQRSGALSVIFPFKP